MSKITIEIDATSEELVDIIGALFNKKAPVTKQRWNQAAINRKTHRAGAAHRPLAPAKKATAKKTKMQTKTPIPSKSGFGWTANELSWLGDWIKTNPVNKAAAVAFVKHFGHQRSLSSLINRAHALRNE